MFETSVKKSATFSDQLCVIGEVLLLCSWKQQAITESTNWFCATKTVLGMIAVFNVRLLPLSGQRQVTTVAHQMKLPILLCYSIITGKDYQLVTTDKIQWGRRVCVSLQMYWRRFLVHDPDNYFYSLYWL